MDERSYGRVETTQRQLCIYKTVKIIDHVSGTRLRSKKYKDREKGGEWQNGGAIKER